jgi:hypothetical protein
MSIIYYCSRRLSIDDDPIIIRGYDKAGNLLSTVRITERMPWDRMEELYYPIENTTFVNKNLRLYHTVFHPDGTSFEGFYDIYRLYTEDQNTEVMLQEGQRYAFYPSVFAVNSVGHIIVASAFYAIDTNISWSTASATVSGSPHFSRVYRRNGDQIPFPQLHGAEIKCIEIGADDRIYIGGVECAADRCCFRVYDVDGTLLWNQSLINTFYDQVCEIIRVSETGVYVVYSYKSATIGNGRINEKYSFDGTLLWRIWGNGTSQYLERPCDIIEVYDGVIFLQMRQYRTGNTLPNGSNEFFNSFINKYHLTTGALLASDSGITARYVDYPYLNFSFTSAIVNSALHVTYPLKSDGFDHQWYDLTTLELLGSSTMNHQESQSFVSGFNPPLVSYPYGVETLRMDTDGVLYIGSRRTETIYEYATCPNNPFANANISSVNAFHFKTMTLNGAWVWQHKCAEDKPGIYEGTDNISRDDGSLLSAVTYTQFKYVNGFGIEVGPNSTHAYSDEFLYCTGGATTLIDTINPPNRNWVPARVFIARNTCLPAMAFSIASAPFQWIGDTYTSVAGLALRIGTGIPTWRREYVSNVRLPDTYRLIITGVPEVAIPVATIQIRRNATATTLTITSPAASSYLISTLLARSTEQLVLFRGVRFADGTTQIEEMLRVTMESFGYDIGAQSGSISLTGSQAAVVGTSRERTLKGISYRAMNGDSARVRCAVDTFLAPGDTALLGNGESMIVGELVYSIAPLQATMEVVAG